VKWFRRFVEAAAVAYPLAILAVAATLRYVGEAWWVSNVGLYLPPLGFALPLPFLAASLYVLRMRRLLWTQSASLVVLLFALMGFVPRWPASAARGSGTLRVLSFNVNSGFGGAEALVDEIDGYAPDIVLLQETGGNEALGRLLRAHYPTVDATDQFILATRFPLSSTLTPDKLPFNGRLRTPRFLRHVLETSLGPIVVYNAHPLSPRVALYGVRGRQGLGHEILSGALFRGDGSALLQDNSGLRSLQVQTLSEAAAKETDPVILAGDTNLPSLSPILHRYLSPFVDGFTQTGWGFGYTFPTNKWLPWMRIDRILANNSLRFVRFEVGHTKTSDHFCVVADLRLRDR